jgi:hypothetical protein
MLSNIRFLIKVACLILISLIFFEMYFYPTTTLFSGEQLLFVTIESKYSNKFVSIGKFNKNPRKHLIGTERPMKQSPVVNISQERYQLVMKYEQDKLADVNTTFKRILFWNDVRFL